MIEEGSLIPKKGDDVQQQLKFFSEIFFFFLAALHGMPFLQQVFQADACHMNFGKHAVYSCYGTTVNGHAFPIALAILFGNEDKDG